MGCVGLFIVNVYIGLDILLATFFHLSITSRLPAVYETILDNTRDILLTSCCRSASLYTFTTGNFSVNRISYSFFA